MAERVRVTRFVVELPAVPRRTVLQTLVVVALGVAVAAFLSFAAARHGFFDLSVYYGAINYWVHDGGQLYDYLLPRTEYGFTYPPFAALAMAPMGLVGWHTAILISVALSAGATFAVLYWLVGPIIQRHGWPRWFALAVAAELAAAFEPLRETVNFGQVNLVLLAMVAGDLLLLLRRGHRLAGVGVGLATAIKLTPGVFIVYLLVTRRWRAAGVASATAAAATWLAATLAPDASRVFWTDAVWNTDRVGSTAFVSNQSLNGIVSRLDPLEPSMSLWAALAVAALAVWALRVRRAVAGRDEATALALTGIFGALISPITWVHHLVWVLPAVVLLFDHALDPARPVRSRRRVMAGAAFSYALLCSRAVWPFEYHYGGWGLLGSNLYALLLCVLLVGLPVRQPTATGTPVVSSRPPDATDAPDLVDLDRRVTAAFDARDAGQSAARPRVQRTLVDARRR